MATRRRAGILRRIWDRIRRVFINPVNNQVISQDEMLRVLEARAAVSKDIVSAAIEQAQAGDISFSQMQSVLNTEIRNLNIQLFTFGRGGISQVSPDDRLIMEGILNEEYTFSAGFVTDIQDGKLSAAGVSSRFNKYMDHSRQSFWEGSRASARASGFILEARILHPGEHCEECVGYANEGKKPIGYFPRIGQKSRCRSGCNCSFEFYKN